MRGRQLEGFMEPFSNDFIWPQDDETICVSFLTRPRREAICHWPRPSPGENQPGSVRVNSLAAEAALTNNAVPLSDRRALAITK